MTQLPEELLQLLKGRSPCYVATIMPDGSPQLTQTWVDTNGTQVVVNTVQGFVKLRNIERDPRVALTVSDPDNSARYFQIRGRVVETTTEGAVEHIEELSQRYLKTPYPWYGGRDQTRVKMLIEADHISGIPG